jgi:hypothetical protein
MRIVFYLFVALAVVAAGYVLYAMLLVNPRVISSLQSNPDSAQAARVLVLTLAGGKQIPVNYLEEDGVIYLGADGGWWRKFEDGGAPVTVLLRGAQRSGHATAITDDPARTADVFSRLRPTAPEWLPDWLNGKLIVIELVPADTPVPASTSAAPAAPPLGVMAQT